MPDRNTKIQFKAETMTNITIRRAVLTDAPQLPHLFETSIRNIASHFYSPDQVDAWAARKERIEAVFRDDFNARNAWVAENDEEDILAYIDLEGGGHIDFFYAHPDVSKTETTRHMYELLEAEARDQGVPYLTTEASESARRFFEKYGFAVTSRNDVILNGVGIHNYRMEKAL